MLGDKLIETLFLRKIRVNSFSKLTGSSNFNMIFGNICVLSVYVKKTRGHRAYFFRKPIFLCVSEKYEYVFSELFIA